MKVTYFSVGRLGTNCYIAYADDGQAVVIDPGDDAQRILDAVKAKNLTVSSVLLTHAHFDHMMAAGVICATTGAALCIGANDAAMLGDARKNLSAMVFPERAAALNADRLLREGDSVAVGEEMLTVMESPGHTPGGVCYMGDGVLFSGDTLFAGSIGRTDLPGGDTPALRRSLSRLAAMEGDYTVYPGHGETTTLAYEKRANPYLMF